MENDSILQTSLYADGGMDIYEQKEFELFLETDAKLKEYVDQYKQATSVLKNHFTPDKDRDKLKQTLNDLNGEYFKSPAKLVSMKTETKAIPFKAYIRWILGIGTVMLAGFFIFNPLQKSLFDQYNIAPTISVAHSAKSQTRLEKAAAFYNKKEFSSAESLLGIEYTADPKNSLVSYYYAITLIQDKQEAKARGILQTLYIGESAFKYNAAYYMALSYLKQKNSTEAKKWLKLVPPGTANYNKAVKLARKL